MRGIHETRSFDVISKEKAIRIPDCTTQVIDTNVEKVWSQN